MTARVLQFLPGQGAGALAVRAVNATGVVQSRF